MHIQLQVEAGAIVDAGFQAFGCPATIATASEIVTQLPGLDLLEAAHLNHEDVAARLALAEHKRGCSEVAADALYGALEDWVRTPAAISRPGVQRQGAVLVAMSGGVDSSAAALILKQEGLTPVGVTFRLWSDPTCSSGGGCCSPETVLRARRVAHALGMAHVTVDLTGEFYDVVVDDFVQEYAAGRTPNPCVVCNSRLRFSALAQIADRLGIDKIATGHYARLLGSPPRLHRALDPEKDQAYVLSRVDPGLLERVVLPLGELTKPEVRRLARDAGLETHDAKESQEICFIPDDDYRRFLAERLGVAGGPIIDRQGRVLGEHRGTYRFTIGQRKGLGLAAPEPLYVCAIHDDGAVVVGTRDDLLVGEVELRDVVAHSTAVPGKDLTIQLRSSGLVVPATVTVEGRRSTVRLAEPVSGVATGQTGVVFAGDRVVLAGAIHETQPLRAPGSSRQG